MKHFKTKLCLLLWRNWKVRLHHLLQTTVCLLLPVFLALQLLFFRSMVPVKKIAEDIRFPPYDPASAELILNLTKKTSIQSKTAKESTEIAWSPRYSSPTSFTDECRSLIKKAVPELIALREFWTEKQLETYLLRTARLGDDHSPGGRKKVVIDSCRKEVVPPPVVPPPPMTLAGIVFADIENPGDPKLCSKRLQITLRFPSELREGKCYDNLLGSLFGFRGNWKTDEIVPWVFSAGTRINGRFISSKVEYGPCPYYTLEGFTVLQTLLTRALLEQCSSQRRQNNFRQAPLNISLRRFSTPEATIDMFQENANMITVLLPILGFSLIFIMTLKDIVREKEHRIKETLKNMGLPIWLYWIGWLITMMTFLVIPNCLYVLICNLNTNKGAVFTESSSTVLFALLLLYSAAQTCFAFLLSAFFSRKTVAGAFGGLIYVLLVGLYLFIDYKYNSIDVCVQIVSCFLFVCAFGIGMRIFTLWESRGHGQHWLNLWEPVKLDEHLSLGIIFSMLILDCILYVLLTLYIGALYPGDYGDPKPWYFIFQKSFWRPEKPPTVVLEDSIVRKKNPANFEAEPRPKKGGIQIRNITKEFPRKIKAVQDVSLNVYENQITVIVGPNGTGKTTMFSMLTGMFPPTHGTALVNGSDIRSDIETAQECMGYCPQHYVFEELTVRDHLYFSCRLKGLSGKELKNEIDDFVRLIQLQDKQNIEADKLSGDMKRKLAVAVALCGKPKVVIFDEPTSGMDPTSRRTFWDLLRIQKFGRTILLITNSMDEADLLGDRIAIMADGRLQCCGTSLFLKNRYGAGSRLVVAKGLRCKASEVTGVLARHMPGLAVSHELASELSYQLDESDKESFEGMLQDLEKERVNLGIISFRVCLTTMDDIYLRAIKIHNEPSSPVTASQKSAGQSNVHRR